MNDGLMIGMQGITGLASSSVVWKLERPRV